MSDTFEIRPPNIGGIRLSLRAITVDDARQVFASASDPEVAWFTLWPPHEREEFTRRFHVLELYAILREDKRGPN